MGGTGDSDAIACGLRVCDMSGAFDGMPSMIGPYTYAPGEIVSVAFGDHDGGGASNHWHANNAGTLPGLEIEVAEIGGTPPVVGDPEVNRAMAEFTVLAREEVTTATLKFRVFDVTSVSGIPVGGLFGQANPFSGTGEIRAYDGDGTLALADYDATAIGAAATFSTVGASAQDNYSVDVTSMYNSWVDASVGLNFGVKFKVQTEPASEDDAITFYDFRLVLDASTVDLATRLMASFDQYLSATVANFRSADSSGSFTAWIKTHNTTGAVQYFFGSSDTAGNINFLRFGLDASGRVTIEANAAGALDSVRTTNGNFDDAAWHHIQIVSSGTAWSVWVDGSSESLDAPLSGTNSGDWFADISGRDNVTVGGFKSLAAIANTFNGDMDEVAVWSDQLTGTNAGELTTPRVLMASIIDDSVVLTGGFKPVNSWPLSEERVGGKGDDSTSTVNLTPIEQPNSAPPMLLDQT